MASPTETWGPDERPTDRKAAMSSESSGVIDTKLTDEELLGEMEAKKNELTLLLRDLEIQRNEAGMIVACIGCALSLALLLIGTWALLYPNPYVSQRLQGVLPFIIVLLLVATYTFGARVGTEWRRRRLILSASRRTRSLLEVVDESIEDAKWLVAPRPIDQQEQVDEASDAGPRTRGLE